MAIKFRAKHAQSGNWYYGTLNPSDDGFTLPLSLFWQQVEKGVLQVDTVGQFTGDHYNGKDEYEGDIVRYCAEDGCYKGVITFEKNLDDENSRFNSGYTVSNPVDISEEVTDDDGELKPGWDGEPEIIGNIIDNPEPCPVKIKEA